MTGTVNDASYAGMIGFYCNCSFTYNKSGNISNTISGYTEFALCSLDNLTINLTGNSMVRLLTSTGTLGPIT